MSLRRLAFRHAHAPYSTLRSPAPEELDVLKIISEHLESSRVPFMLTGSFALGYYGRPCMTRDLDFVVALMEQHVSGLVNAFSADFYIDEDDARTAVRSQRIFNLMHLASGIQWTRSQNE